MKNLLSLIFVAALLLVHMPVRAFDVYIFADMEGCSGVTNRDQIMGTYGSKMMEGDINACVAACFDAGATTVTVRDGHSSGKNVDPLQIDPRAKLLQGPTPGVRFEGLSERCEAVILLGYHAMSRTPNAIMAHSYSSANIQNIVLNGRKVGEIGVDAIVAAEHGVPVVLVTGDDVTCREASQWIDGVVTCRVKMAVTTLSGKCLPLAKSYALIARKTSQALARRAKIEKIATKYPVTLRREYLPKGYGRVYMPDFVDHPAPRIVERMGDNLELLMFGKK